MNYSRLIKPMLVQIPGDSTKANHVCNEVPVVIQGKTFHADLIVLGSQGTEVVLGMNWMTKYKGVINCSKKSISITTSDGDKVAYTATKPSSKVHCHTSLDNPSLEEVPGRDFTRRSSLPIDSAAAGDQEKLMVTQTTTSRHATNHSSGFRCACHRRLSSG